MPRPVQDLDVHCSQRGGGCGILARTRVAPIPRVRSRGDLKADSMSAGEPVSHRPELECHAPAVAGLLEEAWVDALQGVAHVPRRTGAVDVANAREQIEVR